MKKYFWLFCSVFLCSGAVYAQSTLPTGNNTSNTANNTKDTSKTNTNKWKNEDAKITYEKLSSARAYTIDTSLHTFQRQPFIQPWGRDLGNLGSPINNLLFTPENRVGPSLGYHVFDAYRFNADSLNFYNTNRPYSVFSYELGSKLEQTASIMHTQNVKPNWNVSFEYRKVNSPGFYKIQRNNHDLANITTNYHSLNKHYSIYAAMIYNNVQHDENGGIVNDSELANPIYTDRKTVDVAYQNDAYSITRSSVYNTQRDFTFLFQHSYTWGNMDTTYNADSTQYHYKLVPRFSISHKMEISTEKHVYKDLSPDSTRYVTLFTHSFTNNGSGYYTPGVDSVFVQQNWFWIDNKLLLNGFIGKEGRQMEFSAGIGTRFDEFITQPVSNLIRDSLPDTAFSSGLNRNSFISNYIEGQIKKEALHPGEWEYGVAAKLFVTGEDAGNFLLNAALGRELMNGWGSFVAGFSQAVNSAPFSYTNYENIDTQKFYKFNPESVNRIYASLDIPRLRLSGGVSNYVIGNYIYINENETPAAYTIPFTVSQVWVRKVVKVSYFFLDNELVYQQLPLNAPVNVPALMGRHQLSYERAMFKKALKIAIGVEVRYNTAYKPAGYDALLNRFFYQNQSNTVTNPPEAAAFVNFRVKRFRAFFMVENLQTLFATNTILFTGTPVINFNSSVYTYTPVYAAPDLLVRFGFSWPLVN